jgi:hypothetical protein
LIVNEKSSSGPDSQVFFSSLASQSVPEPLGPSQVVGRDPAPPQREQNAPATSNNGWSIVSVSDGNSGKVCPSSN